MRIILAQLNPKVGDVKGNVQLLLKTVAANCQGDLIVFPELFLSGYPPQDLLLRRSFLRQTEQGLEQIREFSQDYPQITLIFGLPRQEGESLYNSAAVLRGGKLLGFHDKGKLTPWGLFEEPSYFRPGQGAATMETDGGMFGLALGLELDLELTRQLKEAGAQFIVNPAAIPYQAGRFFSERDNLCALAAQGGLPLFRAGQVGGNDELIFAGGSLAADSQGRILRSVPDFACGAISVDTVFAGNPLKTASWDETASIYQALVLGLGDYVRKSGFKEVILGISGGLDSAVAAAIASAALGPENVWAVTMPGPYSWESSLPDARTLAKNLGIKLDELSISGLYEETLDTLKEPFSGTARNVAEENIQARLRGNLLMALSNKFGGLVLTNSNKSELSVGYCTLYGDMSGGLAVLGDVYKTQVYQLAYYLNREKEIIPANTLEKPPSAELGPDQRDDQLLPPYDLLDSILQAYLDQGLEREELKRAGYPPDTVHWVLNAVERSEYKRRQTAPILRITTPVLGRKRRMPLAAWRGGEE